MQHKRRLKRWVKILLGLIVILTVASVFLLFPVEKPPMLELEKCSQAISKANASKAKIYAPEYIKRAQRSYDSAYYHLKRQNERIFFVRNYDKVREWVLISQKNATEALRYSQKNSKSIGDELGYRIGKCKEKSDKYKKSLSKLPLSHQVQRNYSKGSILLSEAAIAYKSDNLLVSKTKIGEAEILINSSYKNAYNMLKEYYDNYPVWIRDSKYVINGSKSSGNYAIVVDKMAHEIYIYKGGSIQYQFDADLGENWIGDKQYGGDKATPEGIYHVTTKKGLRNSRYHKALLLNYPNEEDYRRFNEAKRNGTLSRRASIGSLIEIHGEGGKGADWTQGCVALHNSDIDKFFERIPVGTPVAIVGSLRNLSEIID